MLPNSTDFFALWCGLAKLGAVEVPVNTAYRGAILAHVLNDSRAATLIVDTEFLERIDEVRGELTHLKRLVLYGQGGGGGPPTGLAERFEHAWFDELLAEETAPPNVEPRWCDLNAVMYTSGTTGPSKGVMISHAHTYHYALSVVDLLKLAPDDVYYGPLPLFHIAGQWAVLYSAMIAGARAVLPPRFSIESFWDDVARHEVTATFLLGAMANFLHKQPAHEDDPRTPLEKALVVPLFPEFEDFKRRFDIEVTTTYGSTECNVPIRAGFDVGDYRTSGKLYAELYEGRIVDADDQEVPPGVPGEFVMRAKEPGIIMAGYWNRPEATAAAWRNLWLHSGDVLKCDEAGNYSFVDRTKDAIRRRGENISSIEVENEINAHPAVVESAVVPVASEYTEQEVMAVVALKPGERLEPEALIEFLKPRMAYFMVPRYLDFVAELPKTPTGKILKYPLRERGLTASTWDREGD
jgi:crotonobetaine/carnitine-CoA ligase